MNDTLLSLLREARRNWIKDEEWQGDQYGGCKVPTGEALRAFGARIDALLASMQRYAVIVTSKEARASIHNNALATEDGEKFWVTYDRQDRWDSSVRLGSMPPDEVPPDVKEFESREDAERFAKSWSGHPWWCRPKSFEIVPITKLGRGKYMR